MFTAWVVISEPYIEKEYTILAKKYEINTTYIGYACGSDTQQLVPINELVVGGLEYSGKPFELWLPDDIPHPALSVAGIHGNEFTLVGYLEVVKRRNIITGMQTKELTPKIRMTSWTVTIPYDVYGGEPGGLPDRIKKYEAIEYAVSTESVANVSYVNKGDGGC